MASLCRKALRLSDLRANKLKTYNSDEFIGLLGNEKVGSCDICEKYSYKSWVNVGQDKLDQLDSLGEFSNSDSYIQLHGYEEFHPNDTNYWSSDAPIAIAYFPYHECKIKKCPTCEALFLNYVEYGGHAPQKRLRYVEKDLVSIKDA